MPFWKERRKVTPFAGVWIEINLLYKYCNAVAVTPFAGVWIEMPCACEPPVTAAPSLPSRECGLKLIGVLSNHSFVVSLPSRECGLKSYAPSTIVFPLNCHSLRGSVDWNVSLNQSFQIFPCHSLRGSVDWNFEIRLHRNRVKRHSLRGSVDWNLQVDWYNIPYIVTPFAGVWIEISCFDVVRLHSVVSLPSRECGLKSVFLWCLMVLLRSLPSRECGLK